MRLYDPQGKFIVDITYPHDPAVWNYFSLATADNGHIFLESSPAAPVWSTMTRTTTPDASAYLDEIDLHRNILHTYQHPITPLLPAPLRWDAILAKRTR